MKYELLTDDSDVETVKRFATKEQGREAWRAADALVQAGKLFSATLNGPDGKRIFHVEQEGDPDPWYS